MVPSFLRTLSARILLGFAVLIITFGATAVWIVTYMTDLGSEIEVIRTGYLRLALDSKDLSRHQQRLYQYVKDELTGEGTPNAVKRRTDSLRTGREQLLATLERTLDSMAGLPRGHARRARNARDRLETLRESIAALDESYAALLAAPPIERSARAPATPPDPEALEAGVRAHQKLVQAEQSLHTAITRFAEDQEKHSQNVAKNLDDNAVRLRGWTIVMGAIAMMAGLLVAAWASISLRPLTRLRSAARRIARGEHGMRLDERGPAEVADLAREFNVMARAIEERERELVRSERLAAVGKMAAMITHEVRNPLSSIALNVELLGDEIDRLGDDDAKEARALCRAITAEVDRLTGITEDYLAFARLPKPRLQPEPVNPVVDALAQFVREDLATRKIKLDTALADDLPRAMLDEAQIRQSLLNLVRNAAEALAGRGGGRIELATRRDGDRVEIAVTDDGPGISEEAQARLFDPFFSTKEGGTGLGLALTQQIIKDHGGDIRVRSSADRGATFTMSLPVEQT